MRRTLASLALLLSLGALVSIPLTQAQTLLTDMQLGPVETRSLTDPLGQPKAEPAVDVLVADGDGVTVAFELPALDIQAIELGGETYHALEFAQAGFSGEEGEPMLPVFSRLVQIPDEAGVRIEVTAIETTELAGIRPFPVQGLETDPTFRIDPVAYTGEGYPAVERALVGEPALARGLRVVPLTFQPVRYDPARGTIEVATRIEATVTFAGSDWRNVPQHDHRILPTSFDRLYRNLVLNYEGPRDDQEVGLGSYVIICQNNSGLLSRLEPLIEWRTRKGFDVYVATTAETGSSKENIQDWLRNAYSAWANPPEYISIIGDADGSYGIDAWYESYSGYGGRGDHPYVMLDGNDVLADAHIGRISIQSYDDLEHYVAKIVGYESEPYMDDTAWFTKATLAGDPSQSKITCVQIMQWIKRRLLQLGYTEVDTVFSGDFDYQMRNSLTDGASAFCYRGWLGMSGWDSGDINALNNGWRMPYAVNSTCGTGTFYSGTSITESWIRSYAQDDPFIPRGAIASLGTATTGTHTRYNNCMTQGIWRALLWEGMPTFGESVTRGKYNLYVSYFAFNASAVWFNSYWNNLMGDVAGEMWTGVPQMMNVSHDATLALGANSVPVEVTAGGSPCAGATVCLWKGDEVHVVGYTGDDGHIDIPVAPTTTGELKLTVTKHDHHPYLASIDVVSATQFAGYAAHTIDDDASGSSAGNGDGEPNPLETLELPVQLENFGSQTATSVSATLTCADPYVTLGDAEESFGDIAGGATAWSADDFDVTLSATAPHGHTIQFGLDAESGAESWHSQFTLDVVAPAFAQVEMTTYGFGARIEPGESGELSLELLNSGGADSDALTGTLTSQSGWVSVTDETGTFPAVAMGGTTENSGDLFGIAVSGSALPGHAAPMTLVLESSSGVIDSVFFDVNLIQAGEQDPGGPDSYGYYMFDNTDASYDDAPVYDWVELAPGYGGPGIDCGLDDFGDWQDDSKVFDLPFTFQFYGQQFDKVTICSNGWIAMGSTHITSGQNWPMPGYNHGADYMICPMWDDFIQSGSDRVYYYNDTANHRFIVQWSRVRNHANGAYENVEVILYDPAHYPTPTGDGEIVFQYDIFNDVDGTLQYSTVGIQDGEQSDGLQYLYAHMYDVTSATIESGRAIKFTIPSNMPYGTVSGTVYNESAGYVGLPNAQIEVLETSDVFTAGANGQYTGTVVPGTYTLIASHATFAPDTAYGVTVAQDQTTAQNFYLADIGGPLFVNTTDYGMTTDTTGPYEIMTTVQEYSGLAELELRYNAGGAGWVAVPFVNQGGNLYRAEIPGQPEGTQIHYYLYGKDIVDNEATDPVDAPSTCYYFWVLAPALADDMEAGPGGWSHYVATGGFNDQWHRSTARNHTPSGSYAWKFGDTGSGEYAAQADGALESEAFDVDGDATLTFWHWIESEVSGSFPGSAYDGGLVEISVDGGAWSQVTPEGGYSYTIILGSEPYGPFPDGTPVFAGTEGWTQETIALEEISGSVRVRFRFGSDNNTGGEGWYIDDLEVIGSGPGASAVDEIALRPTRLALFANRPNPFGGGSATTTIRFDLPDARRVRLDVIDVNGRLVRTLERGTLGAGQHRVSWNGLDAGGRRVESGVYFYVLQAGDERLARRMLMMR